MESTNRIAAVKRQFFAYRNGIVADVMKRGGSPFRIIFGLNLPQVSEIAASIGYDDELARLLWVDSEVRESMMLAPMLLNPAEVTVDEVVALAADALTSEVADIFALKLLRRMSRESLVSVVEMLCSDDCSPLQRYTGLRAAFGLLSDSPERVEALALRELDRHESSTEPLCRQLLDAVAPQ